MADISVSKFSTGTVQIRPQHVGPTKLPTLLWLLTARVWTKPRPINVYVVRHPLGNVVFDTDQDIASVRDPEYFPRGVVGWLYSRLAKFEISNDQTFAAGLQKLGLKPADISMAVISHLHQDHIGGLAEFAGTQTRVIAHEAELAATKHAGAVLDGYMQDHIFIPGLRFESPIFSALPAGRVPGFDTGWDVFGDGKLILLEVPGHTAGSIALLADDGEAPVLLVGDLTYDVNLLRQGKLPGVGKRAKLSEATAKVLTLASKRPKLVIAAAHDPNVVLPSEII
jgi:N-acyl homoserine lactone hydrolase